MLNKTLKKFIAKFASLGLLVAIFAPFLSLQGTGSIAAPGDTTTLDVRSNIPEGHFNILDGPTAAPLYTNVIAGDGTEVGDFWVHQFDLPSPGSYVVQFGTVSGYTGPTPPNVLVDTQNPSDPMVATATYSPSFSEVTIGVNIEEGFFNIVDGPSGDPIFTNIVGNSPDNNYVDNTEVTGYHEHTFALTAPGSYVAMFQPVPGYTGPTPPNVLFDFPTPGLHETIYADYIQDPTEIDEIDISKTAIINSEGGVPVSVDYEILVERNPASLIPGPLDVNVFDTFANPVPGSMTDNGVTLTVPAGTVYCGSDLCVNQGLEDLTHAAAGVDITLNNPGDTYTFTYRAVISDLDTLTPEEFAYFENVGITTHFEDGVEVNNEDSAEVQVGNPGSDEDLISLLKDSSINYSMGVAQSINYTIEVERADPPGDSGPLEVTLSDSISPTGVLESNGATATVVPGSVMCNAGPCGAIGDITQGDVTFDMNEGEVRTFTYVLELDLSGLPEGGEATFVNQVVSVTEDGEQDEDEEVVIVPDPEEVDELEVEKNAQLVYDNGEPVRIDYSVTVRRSLISQVAGVLQVEVSDTFGNQPVPGTIVAANGASAVVDQATVMCNYDMVGAVPCNELGIDNLTLEPSIMVGLANPGDEIEFTYSADLFDVPDDQETIISNTVFTTYQDDEGDDHEDEDTVDVIIPENPDQLSLDKSSEVHDDDGDGIGDRITYTILAERVDGPGTGSIDVTLTDSIAPTGVLESNGAEASVIAGTVTCNDADCGAIGDITTGPVNFTLTAEASMTIRYELEVDLSNLTEGMQAEFVNQVFSLTSNGEEDDDEEQVDIPEDEGEISISKELLNQVNLADGNVTATYIVTVSASSSNVGSTNVNVSDSFSDGSPAGTMNVNGAVLTVDQNTVTCNNSDCDPDENITLTDVELTLNPGDEFFWIYTANSNNNNLPVNTTAFFENVAVASFGDGNSVEDSIGFTVTNPDSSNPGNGCPPNCGGGNNGGNNGGSSQYFDEDMNVYIIKEISTSNTFYDRSDPANPHLLAANTETTVRHWVRVFNESDISAIDVELSVDFDPGNSGHTADAVMNVTGADWNAATQTFTIDRIFANDEHEFFYETDITTQGNTQLSNHYITLEDYTSNIGVGITNFGTVTRQNIGMEYDSFMRVGQVQQDLTDEGLIVTANADRNEARHEECVLFTITAENTGDAITNLVLIHNIDPSFEISNTFGGNNNGDNVTWAVGDLESGGLVSRQVSLCVRNSAPINSDATNITDASLDQYPFNDQIETTVRIIGDEVVPDRLPQTGLTTRIALFTSLFGAIIYLFITRRRYMILKRKALLPL